MKNIKKYLLGCLAGVPLTLLTANVYAWTHVCIYVEAAHSTRYCLPDLKKAKKPGGSFGCKNCSPAAGGGSGWVYPYTKGAWGYSTVPHLTGSVTTLPVMCQTARAGGWTPYNPSNTSYGPNVGYLAIWIQSNGTVQYYANNKTAYENCVKNKFK